MKQSFRRELQMLAESDIVLRVENLHPSPLNHSEELLVESAINVHTNNIHPERNIFRCFDQRCRPKAKVIVIHPLEKHENASDDVGRRRYIQARCVLVSCLGKETESDGFMLQDGG